MDLEDIERRKSALTTITDRMDLPENRRELHGPPAAGNLRWMLRNLRVRNGQDPMIETALTLAKEILKNI
tara:strand:+ start:629 stop:838 length:210 start_codon:yes stop_codon:yes gene_type:complete